MSFRSLFCYFLLIADEEGFVHRNSTASDDEWILHRRMDFTILTVPVEPCLHGIHFFFLSYLSSCPRSALSAQLFKSYSPSKCMSQCIWSCVLVPFPDHISTFPYVMLFSLHTLLAIILLCQIFIVALVFQHFCKNIYKWASRHHDLLSIVILFWYGKRLFVNALWKWTSLSLFLCKMWIIPPCTLIRSRFTYFRLLKILMDLLISCYTCSCESQDQVNPFD